MFAYKSIVCLICVVCDTWYVSNIYYIDTNSSQRTVFELQRRIGYQVNIVWIM